MAGKSLFLLSFAAVLVVTARSSSFDDAQRSRSRRATPTEEEKQRFLDAINTARADQGATAMNELAWDDELASLANTWAESCDLTEPTWSSSHSEYPDFGHTLSAAGSQIFSIETVLDSSWLGQSRSYDFNSNSCASASACDMFIQLTTEHLVAVGCASELCAAIPSFPVPNARIYICLYSSKFDTSQTPYTVGEACSDCKSGSFLCRNGLCAHSLIDCSSPESNCTCELECQNCGTLDESVCDKCQCVLPYFIGARCDISCRNFNDSCGDDSVFPESSCSDSEVAETCPMLCGDCEYRNSSEPIVCSSSNNNSSTADDDTMVVGSPQDTNVPEKTDTEDTEQMPIPELQPLNTTVAKRRTTWAPDAPPYPPVIITQTTTQHPTTFHDEIGKLEVSTKKPAKKKSAATRSATSPLLLTLILVYTALS